MQSLEISQCAGDSEWEWQISSLTESMQVMGWLLGIAAENDKVIIDKNAI